MKPEAKFQSELKDSSKFYDLFYYKIPDAPFIADSPARFTPRKPFDLVIIRNGVPHGIELKAHTSEKRWPNRVSPHQFEHLEEWRKAGGISSIWLNVRYKADKHINFTVVLPPKKLFGATSLDFHSEQKFIRSRIGDKLRWDLRELLNYSEQIYSE